MKARAEVRRRAHRDSRTEIGRLGGERRAKVVVCRYGGADGTVVRGTTDSLRNDLLRLVP